MGSTTAQPREAESASLPELAAEESELDEGEGCFDFFAFLAGRWPAASPGGLGGAPSSPGLRIWPSTPSQTGRRFLGISPGAW